MTNLMSTLLMSILLLQMCCMFVSPDFIGNQYEELTFVKNSAVDEADISSAGKFLNFITSIPKYLCGSFDHIVVSITNLSSRSRTKHGVSNRKLKAAAAMALSLGLETSILPQRKTKDKKNKELPKADPITSPQNPIPANIGIDLMKLPDKARTVLTTSESTMPLPKNSQKESEGILMGVDENSQPVVMKTQHDSIKENHGASQAIVIESNNMDKQGTIKIDLPSSDRTSSGSAADKTSEITGITPIQKQTNIDDHNVLGGDLDMDTSLFYMYDLDETFWWRWPNPDTDCR